MENATADEMMLYGVTNCLTKAIQNFDRAAKCIKKLQNIRIGMIGYASMGMYTGLGDHVKVKSCWAQRWFTWISIPWFVRLK